jgi:hypothetical protein
MLWYEMGTWITQAVSVKKKAPLKQQRRRAGIYDNAT